MSKKPVHVTMPSLAPLEEYYEILKDVWDRGILTHNGPMVQQFEIEIQKMLGIKHFVAVTNGTIALQMAIKALNLKGEIITTPFTWIATISAIKWEGCTPVFADIDPRTLNIDPDKIEDKITEKTVAIMPVHVFGNPCDVEKIGQIAKKYGLKVIYDAAHAVGSTYNGKSILGYGDISATSLHATKLLNTAEGGGCVTNSHDINARLKRIRFFGHDEQKDIIADGFNGKMTEIHAALGLVNLKYYEQVLKDRKQKYRYYLEHLSHIDFFSFQVAKNGEPNYSYFPVIFDSEKRLMSCIQTLNKNGIYPRRYFFPSVNLFKEILDYQPAPVSEDISKKILCLPLFWNLSFDTQNKIIALMI